MHKASSLFVALALPALAAPLAAQTLKTPQPRGPGFERDLFVGGPNGVILRADPWVGDFTFLGVCGGPIDSMVVDGHDLFIGDQSGNVYHYDAVTRFVDYSFTVSNDATSMVLHEGDLFIGGSDATVLRVDPSSGALLATLTPPVPVTAMVVIEPYLYVGSSAGVVFRSVADENTFSFFGTCGGPVDSMVALGERGQAPTHLLLGTPQGSLYRLDLETQLVDAVHQVASDATAMVAHARDVLVAGSDASVLRVDPATGAVSGGLDAQFEIRAMALGELRTEPGIAYCFGAQCPCGNDDASGGCANTTGAGGSLTASGSTSVAADDLALAVDGLPEHEIGLFYMGAGTVHAALGDGWNCAGSGGYGVFRFPVVNSGPGGSVALGPGIVDTSQAFPQPGPIIPGFTWNFQLWYRDPASTCGAGFNTSNAYSVTFTP